MHGPDAAFCPPNSAQLTQVLWRHRKWGMQLSHGVAGLWRFHERGQDVAGRMRWIEQVLELGIDPIDHADTYGGFKVEALFGAALAAGPGCASGCA
jgi:predicted oxidoreductase